MLVISRRRSSSSSSGEGRDLHLVNEGRVSRFALARETAAIAGVRPGAGESDLDDGVSGAISAAGATSRGQCIAQ